MSKMTGGQALAKSLHREGVRVIFGLPGVQLYHLLDGLYDEADIRFIPVRHEQATTYMADGYARASGDIGTALVAAERLGGHRHGVLGVVAHPGGVGADSARLHRRGPGHAARGE